MSDQASDEQLMLDYCAGDAAAFEVLYQRHRGGLYRYILRQCNNARIAEELYQDVWLNLIRARQRYKVQAKFTTYLYHMAHNRLIDYYRKTSTSLPLSYTEDYNEVLNNQAADAGDEPEQRLAGSEQAEQLSLLLQQLPEAQREVFLLKEESGMSLAEIAEATGVGVETVKSRLRYAFKRLRQAITGAS